MFKLRKVAVLFAGFTVVLGGQAFADKIDGMWCSPKGASISIDQSRVITPGGATVTANYNRHHVDYEIPAGEPNGGGRFSADQLNDDQIRVVIVGSAGANGTAPEIWTPCARIS